MADENTNENEQVLDKNQENGDNQDQKVKVNPRDALVEKFQEEHWRREKEAIASEGLATKETVDVEDESADSVVVPGEQATKEVMEAPVKADTTDPLKDLVVIQEGKPMLRTKVDGVEKFLPLDKVQQTVQKHESADLRLQQASAALKEANARIEQARLKEEALRLQINSHSPSVTPDANVKAAVEKDAKQLSKLLVTGTEDEIAVVLAEVLGKNRQAATPAVNTEEIIKQTVATVKQTLRTEDVQRDMVSGLKKFETDFPEIHADSRLYRYADNLSADIANEHKDWTPSQIFAETGRQTREWIASIKGVPAQKDTPAIQANNRRNENKQKLRPMPSARTERVTSNEVEQPETPASIMAEIRKQRGQAA